MFDPSYTELYLIALVGIVVIVSNFVAARMMEKTVRDSERRILRHMGYIELDDALPWEYKPEPPIDEREFG